MRGDLILYVVHIVGTIVIEAGIYGLLGGGNLKGIMRGFNPIQFVPLDQGAEEISTGWNHGLRCGGERV